MVKLYLRENMKLFVRFLLVFLCAVPCVAGANVATTAGNNLTAWNGNSGATNNNNWNQMMNSRSMATGPVGDKPKADFGNCNSLILRCAQPKCAGCTTMDLARTIVAGCVNSNATCKKHGDDLIEFISAQIVADANADIQQQQLAAQNAAAQAVAAQSSAQMQQMQQQMQQMQYEMQQQNAQQMAQMQAALDEQKQLVADAQKQVAEANASAVNANVKVVTAQSTTQLTPEMEKAAATGVDADLLARNQINGQILSKIENAEVALKKLYDTMQTAFAYAGCDTRGNNCAGPKRVKVFKNKAQQFFRPYDEIVDESYEALEMALAVGVDVSDVIMMLSGACNQWGKFLCTADSTAKHHEGHYDNENCNDEGRSIKGKSIGYGGATKGGMECTPGMAVPPQDDTRCTLTQLIGGGGDNEPVLREWLDEAYEGDKLVRVGCATSALESIAIFGRRTSKQGTTLDLDTLERIILQDAPDYVGGNRYMVGSANSDAARLKYCALTPQGYQNLLSAIQTKKLPRKICVPMKQLENDYMYGGVIAPSNFDGSGLYDSVFIPGCGEQQLLNMKKYVETSVDEDCSVVLEDNRCKLIGGCAVVGNEVVSGGDAEKRHTEKVKSAAGVINICSDLDCFGGNVNTDYRESIQGKCCVCGGIAYDPKTGKCNRGKFEPKEFTFKTDFKS